MEGLFAGCVITHSDCIVDFQYQGLIKSVTPQHVIEISYTAQFILLYCLKVHGDLTGKWDVTE